MAEKVLVKLDNVKKYFPVKEGFRTKQLKALDGISLEIRQGETLGLVGESGCGKSTLGRVLLRLIDKTEGRVYFDGKDVYGLKSKELIKLRRYMQIIFQDPLASLNPKMRIRQIVEEPLHFHSRQMHIDLHDKALVKKMVDEVLVTVGLSPEAAERYPHEFSGGQQQRIGIARALILKPDFLVCDEMVSALDVSVQAQVLNLMQDLKKEYRLTFLFISHNLSVVKHICDRIAVMYLGKIVEIADKKTLFENPLHPYTKALISSIPIPDPDRKRERILMEGDLPSPLNPPPGCRCHTRCVECQELCRSTQPELLETEPGHWVACHVVAGGKP